MKITNKIFTKEELELLQQLKGEILKSVDLVVVARDNLGWNTARIHADNNINIDLNNKNEAIIIDEFNNTDEFGILSLGRSPSGVLKLSDVSEDASIFPINRKVKDVSIVKDTVRVFGNEEAVSEVSYIQAIVFDLEDSYLVLDKETWFSEMIAIKQGNNLKNLIYDDLPNWEDSIEDDPNTHYEYESKTIKL